MLVKIRPITKKAKLRKRGDLIKKKMENMGQMFFKSLTEGPIIAPAFKNNKIITQLCQSNKFIWDNNLKGINIISCQSEICGKIK